jgi:deazaflavin-dependent oxidoreductase (nitroreductase family)
MAMSSNNPMHDFNQSLIAEFRANGGKVTGPFAGAPLLLLTTVGAKSGRSRTTPLVHSRDGDRYVVLASKGGAPTNPSWYYNLLASPRATVEVGAEKFDAIASVAEGEERDRLFDNQAAQMPNFAEYQRRTTRLIPVVILQGVQ